MKHHRFAMFLLALLAFLCGPAHSGDLKPSQPNIIFILADDFGLPGVGYYGGKFKTPHLDALAASGMRFENCFAAPLCGPSRAMLMTGRYAFRTGVLSNGAGAAATPQKDGCVAQLMKQAGYATAVAGKWRQLSHFSTKADGAKWGFDEFLIWGVKGADDDEAIGKQAAKQDKVKSDRYWNPDYNHNGQMLKDTEGKYGPDLLQEFAVNFIRGHKDEPFFVYYPTPLVHGPILPTPDSANKGKTKEKVKVKESGQVYADNIAYLDKQVGQLVAELDRLKLREKTLIVFTGDNGSVGQGTVNGRTVDGGKNSLLEGGSRVPLIASWPGTTPAGVVLKDLVDFSDMLPTFAELSGAKLPTNRKIDGHSFAPQLLGQKGQPRDWAYVQLGNQRYLRSAHWKLTGSGEFFDMQDAPFRQLLVPDDTTNAEAKAARAKLQAALDRLTAEASDSDAADTSLRKKNAKRKNHANSPVEASTRNSPR